MKKIEKINHKNNFTKLTHKRGISLIVLIVTIIVIIILAAAVILTITKNNPGDFVITNQRVVCSGLEENYELSLSSLEAALSVSNSVMKLTSGTRKYFIIFPGDQLKYALAVLRWACSKI